MSEVHPLPLRAILHGCRTEAGTLILTLGALSFAISSVLHYRETVAVLDQLEIIVAQRDSNT